ncbi:hypothetical protein LVV80_00270 [Pseudomonas sp. KCA11]|uniref:hypothetical protein n=1 Tax=unclassified Pseudomonas TaxID=196821 RepID=UPI001F1FA00D|nr:hypothetical protein [Pseudomonas sp. KCA11]MCE5990460.1 hypothetical protein [Pseudomonas sp. KCA11]
MNKSVGIAASTLLFYAESKMICQLDARKMRMMYAGDCLIAQLQEATMLLQVEIANTVIAGMAGEVGHGQQGKRQARAQASEQADGAFVEHGQRTGRYGGRWQHQLRGLKSRSWQPSLRNVARANTPGWRGAGL